MTLDLVKRHTNKRQSNKRHPQDVQATSEGRVALIGSSFLLSKMNGGDSKHPYKDMTSLYSPKEPKNSSDRPLTAHQQPNQQPEKQLGREHSTASVRPQNTPATAFQPPTEVREGAYSFSIYVDLPGVSAQSINITSCTTSVTIQGQRRSPHTESHTNRRGNSHLDSQLISSDRAFGSFERVIQLSQPILGEQVYAEYSHGVLNLELPKQLCSEDPEKMPVTCQSMTL